MAAAAKEGRSNTKRSCGHGHNTSTHKFTAECHSTPSRFLVHGPRRSPSSSRPLLAASLARWLRWLRWLCCAVQARSASAALFPRAALSHGQSSARAAPRGGEERQQTHTRRHTLTRHCTSPNGRGGRERERERQRAEGEQSRRSSRQEERTREGRLNVERQREGRKGGTQGGRKGDAADQRLSLLQPERNGVGGEHNQRSERGRETTEKASTDNSRPGRVTMDRTATVPCQ